MRIILILLFATVLISLALFLYSWYRLHASIDLHVSENIQNGKNYSLQRSLVYFTTEDNIKIAAWYIPVKNPKAVVILVHGYKSADGGKNLMLGHVEYLHNAGYSTLLIDTRSVGESGGNKITFGITEWQDAVAAYDYIKSLPENKNKKVGFLGISMGASTVINAIGETGKGDFIIASVPFKSLDSLFASQIKNAGLPVPIFLPFLKLSAVIEFGSGYQQIAPDKLITRIHVPIFLVSAAKDTEVNKQDAKDLYNEANNPKIFWQANTSHDVFGNDPRDFQKKVLNFLSAIH